LEGKLGRRRLECEVVGGDEGFGLKNLGGGRDRWRKRRRSRHCWKKKKVAVGK